MKMSQWFRRRRVCRVTIIFLEKKTKIAIFLKILPSEKVPFIFFHIILYCHKSIISIFVETSFEKNLVQSLCL